ncbi:MAG: Non-canonical purine NTP pyrophosphatase [Microgenomates group bacterium GW2011_GWC2_46_7]|nr:MAG: Non-canonical purine NTP pyrophosphatase [Microgenomates group bacterium GW2011_GWC2_46_7]
MDETGSTLEENAIIKAETYRDAIGEDVIVLGDDTGLEIDALGGEPGIKVRRWKGYKMTDEEIITYALERLKNVPEDKRTAQFRTVIAVAKRGVATITFSGILPGRIVTEPHSYREEGLPFQPLFFSTDYNDMLYKIHSLPTAEKIAKHIVTHRERAVTAALPYLSTLQSQNQ